VVDDFEENQENDYAQNGNKGGGWDAKTVNNGQMSEKSGLDAPNRLLEKTYSDIS